MKAPPNHRPVQEAHGGISPHWQEFFTAIFNAIVAAQSSGTTANRPTKRLYVGRPYFDTDLGYSINYDGSQWVRWDGTAV